MPRRRSALDFHSRAKIILPLVPTSTYTSLLFSWCQSEFNLTRPFGKKRCPNFSHSMFSIKAFHWPWKSKIKSSSSFSYTLTHPGGFWSGKLPSKDELLLCFSSCVYPLLSYPCHSWPNHISNLTRCLQQPMVRINRWQRIISCRAIWIEVWLPERRTRALLIQTTESWQFT